MRTAALCVCVCVVTFESVYIYIHLCMWCIYHVYIYSTGNPWLVPSTVSCTYSLFISTTL